MEVCDSRGTMKVSRLFVTRSIVLVVLLGCGKGSSRSGRSEDLPAPTARTSPAPAADVPTAFSGQIRNSIELTDEERTAIGRADELSRVRADQVRVRTSLRKEHR